MSDQQEHSNRQLDLLVSRLPREVRPPIDLWPAIEAELSRPSLESLARELPTNIEPPLDLWPQIESRLAPSRSRRSLIAAAAVLATLSALVIAVANYDGVEPDTGERSVASTAPPATMSSGGTAVWWMLQMPPISDDVAATIQHDLGLVRDERQAIEQAIEQDPGDAHLRELWAYAYETELRLENEVGKVMVSYQRGYGI